MKPIALFCAAALFSCAQARPAPEPQQAAAPVRVDGPTAKRLLAEGATLVDVRAPDFYAGGHIDGAINIPWADIEARAAEIGPRDKPVILYCRTGAGSAKGAATLARLGYAHVYDLGSYLNWGEGAPPPTPLPGAPAPDTCPATPDKK